MTMNMNDINLPSIDYEQIIHELKEENSILKTKINENESSPCVDFDYIINDLRNQVEYKQKEIEKLKNEISQMNHFVKPNNYQPDIFKAFDVCDYDSVYYTIHVNPSIHSISKGHSTLYQAVKHQQYDLAELLMKSGVQWQSEDTEETNEFDETQRSFLHDRLNIISKPAHYESDILKAAEQGDLFSIQYILQMNHLRINDKSFFGNHSSLYYSMKNHHQEVSQYLFEQGCTLSQKDINDLFFVVGCEQRDLKILEIIVKLNPTIVHETKDGHSSLLLSLESQDQNLTRFLNQKGPHLTEKKTDSYKLKPFYKIPILGSICSRRITIINNFNDNQINPPQIGSAYKSIAKTVFGLHFEFRIMDGGCSMLHLPQVTIRHADGIFLVFDITSKESIEILYKLLEIIQEHLPPKTPIIVLDNQLDLQNTNEKYQEAIDEFQSINKLPLISVINRNCIEEALDLMAAMLVINLYQYPKDKTFPK